MNFVNSDLKVITKCAFESQNVCASKIIRFGSIYSSIPSSSALKLNFPLLSVLCETAFDNLATPRDSIYVLIHGDNIFLTVAYISTGHGFYKEIIIIIFI